jgi:S-adenosylmethionine decarboxylase
VDCRGTHLIADLYGCTGLDDLPLIEESLRAAVDAIGATLIALRTHAFGEGQGITGVAMLAESHISIHSWPEHGFAAIDIFVCGARQDVEAGLAEITRRLGCSDARVHSIARGGAPAGLD